MELNKYEVRPMRIFFFAVENPWPGSGKEQKR